MYLVSLGSGDARVPCHGAQGTLVSRVTGSARGLAELPVRAEWPRSWPLWVSRAPGGVGFGGRGQVHKPLGHQLTKDPTFYRQSRSGATSRPWAGRPSLLTMEPRSRGRGRHTAGPGPRSGAVASRRGCLSRTPRPGSELQSLGRWDRDACREGRAQAGTSTRGPSAHTLTPRLQSDRHQQPRGASRPPVLTAQELTDGRRQTPITSPSASMPGRWQVPTTRCPYGDNIGSLKTGTPDLTQVSFSLTREFINMQSLSKVRRRLIRFTH